MTPIHMVCSWCGSEDVRSDAIAYWDVETQQWLLEDVLGSEMCEECDGETSLTAVVQTEQGFVLADDPTTPFVPRNDAEDDADDE